MNRTFPASGPIDVDIALLAGSVTVDAGDRDDVEVVVNAGKPDKTADMRAVERTKIGFAGDRLSILQPKNLGRLLVGANGVVEVVVRVPRGSRLAVSTAYGSVAVTGEIAPAPTLETSYGDLSVDETEDATLRTSFGEIRATVLRGRTSVRGGTARIVQTSGETSVTSTHGSIVVDVCAGELTARTSYGNVDIGTALGPVTAKTAYGSVQVRDAARGALRLESSYGSLDVGIREGSAAWLDISSQKGLVRNTLTPAAAPPEDADEPVDVVEVYARTSAGDITIRRAATRR